MTPAATSSPHPPSAPRRCGRRRSRSRATSGRRSPPTPPTTGSPGRPAVRASPNATGTRTPGLSPPPRRASHPGGAAARPAGVRPRTPGTSGSRSKGRRTGCHCRMRPTRRPDRRRAWSRRRRARATRSASGRAGSATGRVDRSDRAHASGHARRPAPAVVAGARRGSATARRRRPRAARGRSFRRSLTTSARSCSQAPRVMRARRLVDCGGAVAVETVDPTRDHAGHEAALDRRDPADLRVAVPVAEHDATRLEVRAVVAAAMTAAWAGVAGVDRTIEVVAHVRRAAQRGAAVVALPPPTDERVRRAAEVVAAGQRATQRRVGTATPAAARAAAAGPAHDFGRGDGAHRVADRRRDQRARDLRHTGGPALRARALRLHRPERGIENGAQRSSGFVLGHRLSCPLSIPAWANYLSAAPLSGPFGAVTWSWSPDVQDRYAAGATVTATTASQPATTMPNETGAAA